MILAGSNLASHGCVGLFCALKLASLPHPTFSSKSCCLKLGRSRPDLLVSNTCLGGLVQTAKDAIACLAVRVHQLVIVQHLQIVQQELIILRGTPFVDLSLTQ